MRRAWLVVVGCLALAGAPCAQAQQEVSVATAQDLAPHVIIRRDTFGVPHITADSDEAAGFGLGYAEAEDHAVEMGRIYLAARGEAARWFGGAYLENDLAMKRLGNLDGARRALADTGEDYRRYLHGFVTGVNLYAAQHRAELPEWFPLVTPADLLAFGHAGAVLGALRAPHTGGAEGEGDLAPGEEVPGSNALAISGRRTTTGAPILLANPHLSWAAQYWEAQITVPGQINFYGSLTVGLAVLRAGFNDTLGYAQTNNSVDLVDHYAVPLDPANADAYVFNGVSHPLRHQTVNVDVLQPDGSVATVSRDTLAADFGPVVARTAKAVIVSRAADLDAWRIHEGFFELYSARTRDEFMATMARQRITASNFIYADTAGNIQYLWNAALPMRPAASVNGAPVDYSGIVPGDTERFFFTGIHPLGDLPQVLNPPDGYVMNSNNPPWFTTLHDRLDPARYPPEVEQGELALRPQFALSMLNARKRFSDNDVRKLKFNDHMVLADRVLPDLLAVGAKIKTPSGDLRQGLRILRAWDREAAARSRGTALFIAFWDEYRAGREALFREPFDATRIIETPAGLADPGAALAALEKAVGEVRARYGAADVAWGDANRFRFGDRDLPADGASGHTAGCESCYGLYRVMRFRDNGTGPKIAGRPDAVAPAAGFGDAWVLMVNFTTPVSASGVLAYGQSSDTASPHSRDQIALFAHHQLRPIWFTDAEVRAHLEREYHPGDDPKMGSE